MILFLFLKKEKIRIYFRLFLSCRTRACARFNFVIWFRMFHLLLGENLCACVCRFARFVMEASGVGYRLVNPFAARASMLLLRMRVQRFPRRTVCSSPSRINSQHFDSPMLRVAAVSGMEWSESTPLMGASGFFLLRVMIVPLQA